MRLSDLPKTFQIISEGFVGETKRHTLKMCGVVKREISAFGYVYSTYSGKTKR
jgi:hypothetical protein